MSRPRTLLLALLAAAVLAGVAVVAVHFAGPGADDRPAATTGSTGPSGAVGAPAPVTSDTGEGVVVTGPPADSEVATDTPRVPAAGVADVVVTFAGFEQTTDSVEVSGFVAGVVEEGGTCTLSLVEGGRTVTAEGAAQPDASTTVCGTLSVDRVDVAAGTWEATLSYSSASSSGASAPAEVEVPAR